MERLITLLFAVVEFFDVNSSNAPLAVYKRARLGAVVWAVVSIGGVAGAFAMLPESRTAPGDLITMLNEIRVLLAWGLNLVGVGAAFTSAFYCWRVWRVSAKPEQYL